MPLQSDVSPHLQEQYQARFEKITAYRRKVWKTLCQDYFSQYIPSDAHILDLGTGYGEFINHIVATKKYAMDLNPDTAQNLNAEVELFQQDCSENWPLPNHCVDVVFTSNFLEHLPDKIRVAKAISEAHRCLKPQGKLICLGPNIKYVPGEYWDFWDHYVPITEQSLSEVLKLEGFEIEHCLPRFLPYSMSTGQTPPIIFLQIYLRLPWVWPLFGKQFLVVGRKSASRPHN